MEQREEQRRTFLALIEGQVGSGIYVWGGNGELLDAMTDPADWIRRHETSEANVRRSLRLYDLRRAQGKKEIRAFDCSGLVYWALKQAGVLKTDVSSRGLYALCTPLHPGEEQAGDLVFHHNGTRIVHVGVCAGSEQIECKGRDDGVVKHRRKAGYWNRVGRLKAFAAESGGAFVVVKGGSVRVRSGDGTKAPCIGIAHRGEQFHLLGAAPSGWYRIAYRGSEAFITGAARFTEVHNG